MSESQTSSQQHPLSLNAASSSAIDPVCGMTGDPAQADGSSGYAWTTYTTCNPSCKQRFDADPDRYLSAAAKPERHMPPPAPTERVEYVCPMHPEVVSDRPGACPKCGMALEPRVAALDEGPDPELVTMQRR